MCLFAANVSGFSFTHHLCGKKSQYYSVTGKKQDNKCCCKGGTKDKGCCKTEVTKVKVDEKQLLAKAFILNKPLLFEALLPVFSPVVSSKDRLIISAPVAELSNPPPLLAASVRLHILFGVFLI